jgi:hypothetical protein
MSKIKRELFATLFLHPQDNAHLNYFIILNKTLIILITFI